MANKESKELLIFLLELGNAVGAALKDGKFDLLDSLKFYRAALAAGQALQGVNKIPDEVKSWSEQDKAEILSMIKYLDLPDDKLEAYAEQALSTAVILADTLLPIIRAKLA